MLHFGPQFGSSQMVWGQRTIAGSVTSFESLTHYMALKAWIPMAGQTTGGIGIFRTETGQPLTLAPNGAYLLDTYNTVYTYPSGAYSFALEVYLNLSESLNLSDNVGVNVVYGVSLSEALGLSGVDTNFNELAHALADAVGFADTYAFNCVYGVRLDEALQLRDVLLTNAELLAYVMNLSNGAMSTYSNFNFNSFAKIGTKYYGATDDGIYELAGSTDAGVSIDASMKLGTEIFGSIGLKRVPEAYLGVSSTGGVVLRTTTNGETRTYGLAATTANSPHTGRLTLGKGVTSRYWDFEVTNLAGGDLDLDAITFYPVQLSRNIRDK